MTYAQALAVVETRAEFEKRMAMHNTMDTVAHIILVVSVAALVWLTWQEIKHRREMKRMAKERAERKALLHSFGSDHYRPVGKSNGCTTTRCPRWTKRKRSPNCRVCCFRPPGCSMTSPRAW